MKLKTTLSQPASFYVLCLLVFLFGGLFQPGDWYTQLNKAPWTPPNLAFPIAWTILYVMIAIVGHQISKLGDSSLLILWFLQLGVNALWSWVFFGQNWTVVGLIDLLLLFLIVAIMAYRLATMNSNTVNTKLTAWLLAPYLVWLSLATSLNAFIVLNN